MAQSELNPIPFNPDTLTLRQVKECADTLKSLFGLLERGWSPEDIMHSLTSNRDAMRERWARNR